MSKAKDSNQRATALEPSEVMLNKRVQQAQTANDKRQDNKCVAIAMGFEPLLLVFRQSKVTAR
jgi:hypothetical protein